MSPADVLAFEARWPRRSPEKVAAIRALGLGEARYFQLLIRAASSAEGMLADPVTARMVRDRSARRAMARAQRTARGDAHVLPTVAHT